MKDVISQTVFLCVFLCLAHAAAGRSGTLAFDGGLNALWIINPEWHSLECSPAVPCDGQRGRGRGAQITRMMVSPLTFSASHQLFTGVAGDCALHVSPASLFCQLSVLGKFRDKYYLSLARMADIPVQSCFNSAALRTV